MPAQNQEKHFFEAPWYSALRFSKNIAKGQKAQLKMSDFAKMIAQTTW